MGVIMSNGPRQGDWQNPYQSVPSAGAMPQSMPFNKTKVVAPGIALIVLGTLATLASVYSLINAALAGPPEVPPDAPEWVAEMMKASVGPLAIGLQSVFTVTGLVVLAGGIQMVRLRSWGLALAASILSMIQLGSCCCAVGMPVGIWSLVILLQPDVKAAFARAGY
jgi:hypothetical protein